MSDTNNTELDIQKIIDDVMETIRDLVFNMFDCPLNRDIFELSSAFSRMSVSKRLSTNYSVVNDPEAIFLLAVENVRPTTGLAFEYDPEKSIDEDWYNANFLHDKVYTYGDLLVFLAIEINRLNSFALSASHDAVVTTFAGCFSMLRSLPVKPMTLANFNFISHFIEAVAVLTVDEDAEDEEDEDEDEHNDDSVSDEQE